MHVPADAAPQPLRYWPATHEEAEHVEQEKDPALGAGRDSYLLVSESIHVDGVSLASKAHSHARSVSRTDLNRFAMHNGVVACRFSVCEYDLRPFSRSLRPALHDQIHVCYGAKLA